MSLDIINEDTPSKYAYAAGYDDGRIKAFNEVKELVINMMNDISQGETTKNLYNIRIGEESAFHRVIVAIKELE